MRDRASSGQRKEEERRGGVEEVGESAGERERYWSDSGVKELI